MKSDRACQPVFVQFLAQLVPETDTSTLEATATHHFLNCSIIHNFIIIVQLCDMDAQLAVRLSVYEVLEFMYEESSVPPQILAF